MTDEFPVGHDTLNERLRDCWLITQPSDKVRCKVPFRITISLASCQALGLVLKLCALWSRPIQGSDVDDREITADEKEQATACVLVGSVCCDLI